MKEIFLIIFLQASYVCGVFAQNKAMYIYRNDGEFNAFLKNEIDSITYSHYDLDGLYHDDFQSQNIHTKDSVYRIPIYAIDSVSFVTPEIKYAPKVRKIDDIIPYLQSVDGMILHFSRFLPQELCPKIGDVLLFENFEHEYFPSGFAGRVSSINANEINCDSVAFSDVYEQYICFGDFVAIDDENLENNAKKQKFAQKHIEGSWEGAVSLSGTVGSTDNVFLTIEGRLGVDVHVVFMFTKSHEPFFDFSFGPTFTAKLLAGAKTDLSGNLLKKLDKLVDLPIPDTPFRLTVSSGPAIIPKLEASLTSEISAALGFRFGLKYKNNNWIPYASCTKSFSPPELTGAIDGSLFAGFSTEVGITTYGDMLSLGFEKIAGAKTSANLSISMLNSNKYDELSKAKLDLGIEGYANIWARLRLAKFFVAQTKLDLWSADATLNSWKFLPSFEDIQISNLNYTSASVNVFPTENLCNLVDIGIGIYNNDKELVDYAYCKNKYRLEKNWGKDPFTYTFQNLIDNKTYTAYPLVIWMGKELKASPSKYFKLADIPVIPYVTTGESLNISSNTATVCGNYENVSSIGTCGIEYNCGDEVKYKTIGSVNGNHEFILTDLLPATKYNYRAFVVDQGMTYYGENKSFTTSYINCSVTLSDFKVTKSQFKEGGFTNDDQKYDFRFDTSVTGTIKADDMSYVEEWGYVYEDPEGKIAEIPLTGNKETVTRYAYFRNSAQSTARLYGYAYLKGIEKPIYFEVHDFLLIHNMAVANTGEYSNVSTNSAIVTCSFENIPEGATCGIEYTEGQSLNRQTISISKDGIQTVNLLGLKQGTKYEYRAFIDDNGQMYYGGQLEFTTGIELPDLSGIWNCTIYKNDDSVLAECKYEFTSDHKVTHNGSDRIPDGEVGSWSIDANGKVGINFSWTGGSWSHPVWYVETYGGQVNSISNPSSIEGSVYRAWAGTMSEHGDTYKFKMTK